MKNKTDKTEAQINLFVYLRCPKKIIVRKRELQALVRCERSTGFRYEVN